MYGVSRYRWNIKHTAKLGQSKRNQHMHSRCRTGVQQGKINTATPLGWSNHTDSSAVKMMHGLALQLDTSKIRCRQAGGWVFKFSRRLRLAAWRARTKERGVKRVVKQGVMQETYTEWWWL